MKVITFYSPKGGIGKSNTCVQLAQELASQGYKVLTVDGDPQSNLTSSLYKVNLDKEKTLMNLFVDDLEAKDLIVNCKENIDLIANDISSIILAEKISHLNNREKRFGIWCNRNKEYLYKYDYILIDTNCSFDLVAKNLIIASDTVISIVAHSDFDSIKGASLFASLKESLLKDLEFEDDFVKYYVLLNRHKNTNTNMSKLFDRTLKNYKNVKDKMLDTFISESVFISESTLIRKTSVDDLLKNKKIKNNKVQGQYKKLIQELKEKDVM